MFSRREHSHAELGDSATVGDLREIDRLYSLEENFPGADEGIQTLEDK